MAKKLILSLPFFLFLFISLTSVTSQTTNDSPSSQVSTSPFQSEEDSLPDDNDKGDEPDSSDDVEGKP